MLFFTFYYKLFYYMFYTASTFHHSNKISFYAEFHTVMSAWLLPNSSWRKEPGEGPFLHLPTSVILRNPCFTEGSALAHSLSTSHAPKAGIIWKHEDVRSKGPMERKPLAMSEVVGCQAGHHKSLNPLQNVFVLFLYL